MLLCNPTSGAQTMGLLQTTYLLRCSQLSSNPLSNQPRRYKCMSVSIAAATVAAAALPSRAACASEAIAAAALPSLPGAAFGGIAAAAPSSSSCQIFTEPSSLQLARQLASVGCQATPFTSWECASRRAASACHAPATCRNTRIALSPAHVRSVQRKPSTWAYFHNVSRQC